MPCTGEHEVRRRILLGSVLVEVAVTVPCAFSTAILWQIQTTTLFDVSVTKTPSHWLTNNDNLY